MKSRTMSPSLWSCPTTPRPVTLSTISPVFRVLVSVKPSKVNRRPGLFPVQLANFLTRKLNEFQGIYAQVTSTGVTVHPLHLRLEFGFDYLSDVPSVRYLTNFGLRFAQSISLQLFSDMECLITPASYQRQGAYEDAKQGIIPLEVLLPATSAIIPSSKKLHTMH